MGCLFFSTSHSHRTMPMTNSSITSAFHWRATAHTCLRHRCLGGVKGGERRQIGSCAETWAAPSTPARSWIQAAGSCSCRMRPAARPELSGSGCGVQGWWSAAQPAAACPHWLPEDDETIEKVQGEGMGEGGAGRRQAGKGTDRGRHWSACNTSYSIPCVRGGSDGGRDAARLQRQSTAHTTNLPLLPPACHPCPVRAAARAQRCCSHRPGVPCAAGRPVSAGGGAQQPSVAQQLKTGMLHAPSAHLRLLAPPCRLGLATTLPPAATCCRFSEAEACWVAMLCGLTKGWIKHLHLTYLIH
eukprot:1159048-Pelagomonas_calceolata.AAC.7